KEVLFDNLDMVINAHDKIALVGNNGTGKSTLLKIMSGGLNPSAGTIKAAEQPYYVPQVFGQFNNYTVAQALQVEGKIKALHEILAGNVAEENFTALNDDWDIEERCKEALACWQLDDVTLSQKM